MMQFVEPIIGGLAAFALGFAWYTVLFGKAWQAETGMTAEDAQKDMARTHGLALLMMIIMSYAVNFIINMHPLADQTFIHGAFHGALAGLLYAAPSTAINYLYQRKSLKLYLIDASYQVLFLALSGGVMAALKLA
ncbi:MAG: DUF1761 domain-containing protein [Chitinophagales bacterium]